MRDAPTNRGAQRPDSRWQELLASGIGDDLEDRDERRARAALPGRHGALYRNHPRIAVHLD
ncbi:hypothetical protein [Streptomyces sp. DSM 118148]|uniref:hypothetical protein n=1 Tax=Streptomyces sp. DSM 118148 TaxID=3448667 RepID=UPI00403FEEE9